MDGIILHHPSVTGILDQQTDRKFAGVRRVEVVDDVAVDDAIGGTDVAMYDRHFAVAALARPEHASGATKSWNVLYSIVRVATTQFALDVFVRERAVGFSDGPAADA